jgi:hypothetical protein
VSIYTSQRGGFVRFGSSGPGVRWTNSSPLFSERNGYRLPFMKAFGWRFFWLKRECIQLCASGQI